MTGITRKVNYIKVKIFIPSMNTTLSLKLDQNLELSKLECMLKSV
jgi:hypothetical protein